MTNLADLASFYAKRISENSCVCLQCNETVFNPFYKRRLFWAESGKSKACQRLEKVLDVEINQSTVETDIICRNCNDKNSRLVCKLEETRSVYENSKKQRRRINCSVLKGSRKMAERCLRRNV